MNPRWDVHDHATARAALVSPALSRAPGLRGATDPLEQHVLNLDGDEHRRLRAVLDHAIGAALPAVLTLVRPRAALLLGALDGEADVAARFVRPLVLVLMDELLGLTGGDAAALDWWHRTSLALERGRFDTGSVRGRIDDLLAAPRGGGVVARLAESAELPREHVVATVFFAFDAGYVNTVNFLGRSLLAFARFPGEYEWLRGHPEAVPGAVEELLRFAEPPARASMRVAAADVDLAGRAVAAGTTVWIHRASANRDPRRFPQPDRLDLRREETGSLAFGAGPHYCLGASLVRSIADLTLLTMLPRVERFEPTERTRDSWDFPDPLLLRVCPIRP